MKIEKLRQKLNNVSDAYPEFVKGVIHNCEHHKDKNPNIAQQVLEYIQNNPKADTSDIIEYTSDCKGLPWEDDDGVWHRWDAIITKKEAKRIVQTEYCDDYNVWC